MSPSPLRRLRDDVDGLLAGRRPRGQAGMTLVETMLTVMLSALMITPMMGWVSVSLKEQASSQQRNMSSTSLGLLRSYFVRDVTNADWAATAGDRLASCGGAAEGATALITLGRGDLRTSYTLVPVDGFTSELRRLQCSGDGSSMLGAVELMSGVIDGGTSAACDSDNDLDAAAAATGVAPTNASGASGSKRKDDKGGTDADPERVACRRVTLRLRTSSLKQAAVTALVRSGNSPAIPDAEIPIAVATAAPTAGPRRLKVQFDGTGSYDPVGDPVGHAWDFGDGATSAEAAPAHDYVGVGTYTATLTVTSISGLSASTTIAITVADNPPIAVISSPPSGTVTYRGAPVGFSSAGSGDLFDVEFGGRIVSLLWDFGDGTSSTDANPVKLFASTSPPEGYLVRLGVVDDAGLVATAETRVIVANRQPTVGIVADPASGPSPLTVDLSAIVIDETTMAPAPTLTYAWDFGDGATSATADPPPRTYAGEGTRTVTLTVTDDQGAAATATQTITVGAPLLAAPSGLRFVRSGAASGLRYIDLSWTARSGAALYEVQLVCDGCAGVHTATSASTAVRVSGLRSARTHYFASIRARNAAGEWGPWSSTVRMRS